MTAPLTWEAALGFARALTGQEILSWSAVEMALDPDATPPVFRDVTIPCIQCYCVDLQRPKDKRIRLCTRMTDHDGWVLRLGEVLRPDLGEASRGFRHRPLPHLPRGPIQAVDGNPSARGDIHRLRFRIGNELVFLVAGEIEGEREEGFHIQPKDESVLIFTDPRDLEQAPWMRPLDA